MRNERKLSHQRKQIDALKAENAELKSENRALEIQLNANKNTLLSCEKNMEQLVNSLNGVRAEYEKITSELRNLKKQYFQALKDMKYRQKGVFTNVRH